MNKWTTKPLNYNKVKEAMFSGGLTSYNFINLLKWELKKILSEEYNLLKIKKLNVFSDELVKPCANDFFVRSDFQNQTDIHVIKELQDIKQSIWYQKRIIEDAIFSKHIDNVNKTNVNKTNDTQYISSTLVSLCEEYWDTEYIERKIFLREQAEKYLKNVSDAQKYKRKKDFAYKDIIALTKLQP